MIRGNIIRISGGAPDNHQSSVSCKKKKIRTPVKAPKAIFNLQMLKTPNYKHPEPRNSALLTALI